MAMEQAQKILISPEATIRDALLRITETGLQLALVGGPDERLLGIVTDGDVRRAILGGFSLDDRVDAIMNRNPVCLSSQGSREDLVSLFSEHRHILRIPAVDDQGRVIAVHLAEDLLPRSAAKVPVVIMAGGLGTRLRPYTDTVPKPMIDIAGKPILERTIARLKSFGFRDFYISVNYLRDCIKDHFGNGERFGVNITYLEENERLGTAGALRLLPAGVGTPIIVMNGDILTDLSFRMLLDHFDSTCAQATMCLRPYVHQIPYGVASFDGEVLVGIDEKPQLVHFINAGIYVLDQKVLSLIPAEGYYDMPSLYQQITDEPSMSVSVFPIHEYWIDIGNPKDLEAARGKVLGAAGRT